MAAYTGLEIAIIGIACRFPEAPNWRTYWENLMNGKESVRFYNDEELQQHGQGDRIGQADFVKAGVRLTGKDRFDAAFFGYRPAEAALMHPAHRIFHECVWEALEDAAYYPDDQQTAIGLFAGAGDDMHWRTHTILQEERQEVDEFSLHLLNNAHYLTSLVAYKLDLKGPGISVNTACSTSLVAVNMACKSLLLGEVKMALAGGVHINTDDQLGYLHQEGMIHSADGHCRPFDKAASGTIGGEGAGVVVLKRLSAAMADGDHIYAIIKGSAINNDGNRKVGYTAPSVEGQAACISRALAMADVEPHTVRYIETHGTGTRLGDPIELEALNKAYNNGKNLPCAIGFVKANIGHLDAAAGVAGLIKAALVLYHRTIPPALHYREPNPAVNFAGGPFYINTQAVALPVSAAAPARTAVSSFGIGGTNAHAILEEAPQVQPVGSNSPCLLLCLSARTGTALSQTINELLSFLTSSPATYLPDLAYTLQVGRKAYNYRYALAFRNRETLMKELVNAQNNAHLPARENCKPIFMFPGQGAQYVNMARELYMEEPVFYTIMEEGFALLQQWTGVSFRQIIYPDGDPIVPLEETQYTQPLIFLTEYALSRLLESRGIRPAYMIGHSIGEYVAACISGVFTFTDALKLVVRRGALMSKPEPGIMISAQIDEQQAAGFLHNGVCLAAVNSPAQVVFSGDQLSMTSLVTKLEGAGINFVKLHTSHAFHSGMLDNILIEFEAALKTIALEEGKIPFISNLTGDFITSHQMRSPGYWVQHMRQTVLFSAGIQKLIAREPAGVFIEAGPGKTLTSLLKQQAATGQLHTIRLLRGQKETGNDHDYFANALAGIWTAGIPVNWMAFYKPAERRRISLPTYPFEGNRYPAEVDLFKEHASFGTLLNTHNDSGLAGWLYFPGWKNTPLVQAPALKERKTFLYLTNRHETDLLIRDQLQSAGHHVIEVTIADVLHTVNAGSFSIQPMQAGNWSTLLDELTNDQTVVTDILYGWGMLATTNEIKLREEDQLLQRCFFYLIKMVQALLGKNSLHHKRIWILTDRLHSVISAANSRHGQSLLLGPLHVLPQEYGVPCCNLDLDSSDCHGTIPLLIKELTERPSTDRIVAFRHGKRWVQQFQQHTAALQQPAQVLKKGGVYLVTGGLGQVGSLLAKHLLENYQAKVILIGRTQLQSVPVLCERSERLSQLTAISREISYRCVDVTDETAFYNTVLEIEENIGRINGVIHAAGNIDRRYFETSEAITSEKAMAVMASKIAGLQNLYRIFENRQPDFVWITSSLSSIMGGVGFTAYTAANSFMEHLVQAGSHKKPQWTCIGLSDMALNNKQPQPGHGKRLITPPELIALFEWSIGQPHLPVIYETIEPLDTRMRRAFSPGDMHSQQHRSSGSLNKTERPVLKNNYVAPATDTEQKLAAIIEDFLGIRQIGMEDNFYELGGDSLKGMVLLKRIKQEFNIDIALNDLFTSANIRATATEIDSRLWFRSDVQMNNEIKI